MNNSVVVLGAGGHARVIVGLLREQGYSVEALIAPKLAECPELAGFRHYVNDSDIELFSPHTINVVNAVGSLPRQFNLRKKLFIEVRERDYNFETLVDSSAIVSQFASLKMGVQILPGAILNGCTIGENTIINSGAIVEHDVNIGSHCHIAPGAIICGDVQIGNDVHIGAGATLIQGVKVGHGAIVGAGAILTQDLDANDTLYPARSVAQSVLKEGR